MSAGAAAGVAGLDAVLSQDGWPYASALPTGPDDPGRFHALFGRDALICALQVLPARPDVARATLRALAALQGRADDDATHEAPGKILHEYRSSAPEPFLAAGWPDDGGEFRYYGSADATAWFCVVLAALGDRALAGELEGAWRAAGGWLERALDQGGGFVRYGAGSRAGGLTQQGWRDTIDPRTDSGGILRADGGVPRGPLADADTQAAAYAGLRALAVLSGEDRWAAAAVRLSAAVSEAFGPEVMALEGDGTPVAGAGSQLGWLLWSGVLQDERAVAERVCEPDVLTAYGLRTLSSAHPAFGVHDYHRGSVWPFDCWLGWGGLRVAGQEEAAERVRTGVLAALDRLGQAPELYAVTVAGELEPVAAANHVQAWTVGARWALERRWDGRAAPG